jgi:hypothetical protein
LDGPETRVGSHGLLLPMFMHCVDDQGRTLLEPTRKGPEGKAFLPRRPQTSPPGRGHAPILYADPFPRTRDNPDVEPHSAWDWSRTMDWNHV